MEGSEGGGSPCPACGKSLDVTFLGSEAYRHVFSHLELGSSMGHRAEFEVMRTKVASSTSWGPLALLWLRQSALSNELAGIRREMEARRRRGFLAWLRGMLRMRSGRGG